MPAGIFIAFEGIDGSGKSTVAALAAERAQDEGYDPLLTHEPTEGEFGKRILAILHGELPMPPMLELQRLYVRDRKEHVSGVIAPALAAGKLVLADRYWLSTIAYGMLGGVPQETLVSLHEEIFAGDFLKPDLAILLDLPAHDAIRRLAANLSNRPDYFEKLERLERVRHHYLECVRDQERFGAIAVVDAAPPVSRVAEEVWRMLAPYLPARPG